MNETWMFTIRTLLFVVFIWLLTGEKVYSVESSWMGKREFDGEATGIIRDIIEQDGTVFIGAENGLFKIIGNSSKQYSHNNSPLGKGYISDLYVNGDTLYISEFGNGLFTYSFSKGVFSKLNIPDELAVKSWSVLSYEKSVVVSVLSGIVLLSGSDNSIIVKEHLDDGSVMRSIYSLTVYDNLIAASEANHLIFMDGQLNEVKVMDRSTHFSEISKITYAKTIGKYLYVGGIGGVYRLHGAKSVFYPASIPENQYKEVESIIEDSEGRIWVAAGGLLLLDETSQVLRELKSVKPKYSFEQIRAVQAIYQLENTQLLIASTQLGLLSLDLNLPPINYLHETNFPYRKDIYSIVPVGSQRYIAKSKDKWLWLNSETANLKELKNVHFEREPIPIGNRVLVPDVACNTYRYVKSELIQADSINDPGGYCLFLKTAQYSQAEDHYIYYQAPTHAGFVKLKNDALSHYSNAPKNLNFLANTKEIPAIILDKNNVLYLLVEQGVWIKHELNGLKGVFVYCMYTDATSIYFCTSGQGLKRFDIGSNNLVDAFKHHEIPRFIRAGILDTKGNHWLATNKGFVFLNRDYLFRFDASDGVIDTDFNYRGMLPLNGREFILVGDQLSYAVNTEKTASYIEKRREHKAQAAIFNVEFLADSKQSNNSKPQRRQQLDYAPDEIIFEFASADYVYSHLHKLEYRLVGFHDDWQELPTNIGTVAYSGLSFGDFDFQVRVVDSKSNRSQPISQYGFNIARPFWYTWQAYLLYLVAISLFIWLAIILIKRHMAERSRVLAGVIDQKQSALIESNRSITELLNKKEKIFSNLANEIKTPLMQMLNPLVDLRARPLTADVRSKIDLVYDNAGRLRVLTDQLAAVERINHISEQILQRYDIKNTLDFLIETLRPAALEKQLVLSYDSDIKVPVLLIRDSLEALVNPLLLNAISYTQAGGQVRIKASVQADQIVLYVKDNGPGIVKEQLEFIISRFSKGSNYNGSAETGIGLNLANSLALANDGWLEIISEPHVGTEVTAYLMFTPALASEEAESNPSLNSLNRKVAEVATQYRQSNLPVVLVIERSHASCEYIINLLGDRFNCYSVQRGMQALELIPILQPDIILTELNIPDISGAVFTQKLRELHVLADVPVMILTATSDYRAKLDCFKASVNDYLIKPVEQDELISRIESNLTYARLAHRYNTFRSTEENADTSSVYVKTILPKCSNEKERKFIVKFLDIIEKNYQDENFNRSRAADLMAVSERQLNRILSKLMPDNFSTFLKKYRLEKSMPMLEKGLQITQIAFDVGFGSGAYYSRCFRQVHGLLPSEYEFPKHDKNETE